MYLFAMALNWPWCLCTFGEPTILEESDPHNIYHESLSVSEMLLVFLSGITNVYSFSFIWKTINVSAAAYWKCNIQRYYERPADPLLIDVDWFFYKYSSFSPVGCKASLRGYSVVPRHFAWPNFTTASAHLQSSAALRYRSQRTRKHSLLCKWYVTGFHEESFRLNYYTFH